MRVAHITATKLQWSVRIRWQRSPGRDSLIAFGRDGAVARGGTALPYYPGPGRVQPKPSPRCSPGGGVERHCLHVQSAPLRHQGICEQQSLMRRRKIRFLGGEYLKWFEFWGYRGSVASYATPKLGSASGAIPCEGRLKVLSFRAILRRSYTEPSFEYGGPRHEKTISFVPSCIARSGTPVRQRVRCRSGSECGNAGGQAVALV